jgi:hypothetical protein
MSYAALVRLENSSDYTKFRDKLFLLMAGRNSFGKCVSIADYKGGEGTQILLYGVYKSTVRRLYTSLNSYLGERGRFFLIEVAT